VAGWLAEADPDPRVSTAAQLLWRRPHAEVAEVADAVGWSTRQLRRALPAEVGLGPKTLQRVGRLQRFLALVRTGRYPWLAELAVRRGLRRPAASGPRGASAVRTAPGPTGHPPDRAAARRPALIGSLYWAGGRAGRAAASASLRRRRRGKSGL